MKALLLLLCFCVTIIRSDLPPPEGTSIENEMCGDNSFCVPYYKCDNRSDAATKIDRRANFDICSGIFDTCCESDSTESVPEQCGIRNTNGVKSAENHKEAFLGEFPWMLAVVYVHSESNIECLGGASLIKPTLALTAAHILDDKDALSLKIRAGVWNSSANTEQTQTAGVNRFVVHPKYDRNKLRNNVAFLFLAPALQRTATVNTICLPDSNYMFTHLDRCVSTGWGTNNFNNPLKRMSILKAIDMSVVRADECQTLLRKTRLGNNFHLHSSYMCAGGEYNSDMCSGDGGAPLACLIDGQYYLAGIVSWGIGCNNGNPGVYANVPALFEWIESNMIEE